MLKIPISIPALPFRFKLIDAIVLIFIISILSLIIYVASGWRYEMQPSVEISLDPANIPIYSMNSLLRIFLAYILSLVFSIWYGYTANRSRLHEKVMIPLLDILQSIPVLSFLPGVVLAMIAIFPHRRLSIELASILLIFTGQVWNMAFSYYNSINTIPKELIEVTKVFRLSRFVKFFRLDLPFSAIGLVWNSMMSVAGGWFFLMACEMFVLKDRDFRLPGIGSYIQTAANHGDMMHVLYGIGTMIFLIIILDILIWRPLVAWSQKFRMETVQAEDERESFVLNVIRKSSFVEKINCLFVRITKKFEVFYDRISSNSKTPLAWLRKVIKIILFIATIVAISWAGLRAIKLFLSLSVEAYLSVFTAAGFSILRTSAALLIATLWTVPLGVYIGMNPKAARILQPIVQVVASIPATAVFPVILLFLIKLGGGLAMGSIFLMLLGTQWYILFNVIAGASAIPQDLKETAQLYGLKGIRKWKVLILPGIFPYLVTGLITATGGAWNASIVSEYVTFGGETMKTRGLGSLISESTVSGDFGLLLVSTVVMAFIVVCVNRLAWKRMFAIAQEKYRLE
ncbi:ABC transporter permease [Dissulfurispira thermophila]|uniref:ABC transporter permease n=1 Tax=Dissulfurispira thermophila TaxID=2715679 RepID=A0A7G1H3D7_9BACT|nr:ABC transporter permease subunit [Dissulfurispira thermophila]BCB96237.1 ABC transporter permease [Dissulfurispira thermophila]